jgi:hypothetical protein
LSFSRSPSTLIGERVSVDQWHSRLGHPALRVVRRLLTSYQLPVMSNKTVAVCSFCQLGKLHKLHFPVSPSMSTGRLDLLFMDVWGPAPLYSYNNKRYFLCVVDDFSHYSWVFPLTCKSNVITMFTNFKRLVENLFGHSIKSVQTNVGGEFLHVQKLLKSHDVSYRQTCPHTHHQNGTVERKIRHIVDTGLALLAHSHVPFKFWDDAFDTAYYLINCLPSAVNSVSSPFELLFNKSPDFNLLKVFGCKCWPYLRPYNSHKMFFKSLSCVFLGYSNPHIGYKCLHIPMGRVYIVCHVIFHETKIPFQVPSMPVAPLEPASTSLPATLRLTCVSPTLSPPIQVHNPSVSASSTHSVSQTSLDSVAPSSPPSQLPLSSPSNDPPTRMHPMVTRAQNNIHQPKHYNDGTARYPLPRAYTASLICDDVEPTSYTHAAKNVKWRATMVEEFNALIKTGT